MVSVEIEFLPRIVIERSFQRISRPIGEIGPRSIGAPVAGGDELAAVIGIGDVALAEIVEPRGRPVSAASIIHHPVDVAVGAHRAHMVGGHAIEIDDIAIAAIGGVIEPGLVHARRRPGIGDVEKSAGIIGGVPPAPAGGVDAGGPVHHPIGAIGGGARHGSKIIEQDRVPAALLEQIDLPIGPAVGAVGGNPSLRPITEVSPLMIPIIIVLIDGLNQPVVVVRRN